MNVVDYANAGFITQAEGESLETTKPTLNIEKLRIALVKARDTFEEMRMVCDFLQRPLLAESAQLARDGCYAAMLQYNDCADQQLALLSALQLVLDHDGKLTGADFATIRDAIAKATHPAS